jgi:CBS domain containing-hemolysin-like protein
MLVLFISVGTALTISFLCSLAEATLLSLTPSQVADISARHPAIGAIWRKFKDDIERPISAILILNTTAHTVGAAVAGGQVDALFGSRWVGVFSALFTFLMLQYTEILPKSLGVRHNRTISLVLTRPLDWLAGFLRPVIRLLYWINRPFEGARPTNGPETATIDEIRALAGMARLANMINTQEERIILGASRLSSIPLREIMIPMDQVTSISSDESLLSAIVIAHMDPHTRFPVRNSGDPGKIVGYVNFKEMIYFMRTNPGEPNMGGIVRPVQYVQPNDSASHLLQLFVEQHVHLAIVSDDVGNAIGLITLEDIVERLVGSLEDEFDRAPRMFHGLVGGTFMVGGGITMQELAEKSSLSIPSLSQTLSDWLLEKAGELPRPGAVIREADVEFQVRRVRRGKVFEVSVSQAGQPHPGMPPPAGATPAGV